MLNLIKSYQPLKKRKISPTQVTLVSEKENKIGPSKEATPTCNTTPTSTRNLIQDLFFPYYEKLQLNNEFIPESSPSYPNKSGLNNLYPINSSIIVESEIKKDDKDEIMTYIKCLFHDFRCPLNNISMGIDILDETILKDNETQEILIIMKESSKFIANALDGFLNINNIVSGDSTDFMQINNKNFNIIDCIKKTEKLLLYKIKSKGLIIEHDLSEVSKNEEYVYGDGSNLQHVFMNLLSNAVKFSEPNTKIVLRLTVKKETSEKQYKNKDCSEKIRFVYVIIDENKHIDPKIKKNLFKKYNTSNTITGTGLGLYICKKIAELNDGKIEHEYNYPKGNIFRVEIALEVRKPTVSPTIPSLVDNKLEATLREGVVGFPTFPTFYIVDDSSISRKMLRTLLQLKVNKTEIILIEEESDGLDLIKKMGVNDNLQKTNVIFIDNQMPNLNGILATKLIRALGYKNYIIGITGDNERKDVDEFKKNGADYVFIKPLTKDNLNDLFCVFERTFFKKPFKPCV